jgi:hypothetical protein
MGTGKGQVWYNLEGYGKNTVVGFSFVLFFEAVSHCVAQAGLKLQILLLQPPSQVLGLQV